MFVPKLAFVFAVIAFGQSSFAVPPKCLSEVEFLLTQDFSQSQDGLATIVREFLTQPTSDQKSLWNGGTPFSGGVVSEGRSSGFAPPVYRLGGVPAARSIEIRFEAIRMGDLEFVPFVQILEGAEQGSKNPLRAYLLLVPQTEIEKMAVLNQEPTGLLARWKQMRAAKKLMNPTQSEQAQWLYQHLGGRYSSPVITRPLLDWMRYDRRDHLFRSLVDEPPVDLTHRLVAVTFSRFDLRDALLYMRYLNTYLVKEIKAWKENQEPASSIVMHDLSGDHPLF